MNKLEPEQKEILKAFEAGTMRRAENASATRRRHQSYAGALFKKDARINIRIASKDLRGLQKKRWRKASHIRRWWPAFFINTWKAACANKAIERDAISRRKQTDESV